MPFYSELLKDRLIEKGRQEKGESHGETLHLCTDTSPAPKCQHDSTVQTNELTEDKMSDPLSPVNISESISRLVELRERSSNTKDVETLDQAMSILRHTESIIDSIRRASVGMVSEDIEAQTMISSVEDTPVAVKEWLAATFTKQIYGRRQTVEIPKFRSIVQAVRATMYVDRIYRKHSSVDPVDKSPTVMMMRNELHNWDFDIFHFHTICQHQPFQNLFPEILGRYDLVKKYKINLNYLDNFCALVEAGYEVNNNPYHNVIHGADVLQTTHHLLSSSGFATWLTDIEILSLLFAAMIHDVEHTGTTNNFHINTRSNLTMLYNDRSVLENHHISTAFKYLEMEECNPFHNLSKEDFREMRGIVVEAVLGTDMSAHFTQIKNMQNALFNPSTVNRNTAMTLVLHCADISHPTKEWKLHKKWTDSLMEEFFVQGDKETALNLANSPLCNRDNTLIPESQVGFIDFIITPSMNLLGDMLDALLLVQHEEASATANKKVPFTKVRRPWEPRLNENKNRWKALVTPKIASPDPDSNALTEGKEGEEEKEEESTSSNTPAIENGLEEKAEEEEEEEEEAEVSISITAPTSISVEPVEETQSKYDVSEEKLEEIESHTEIVEGNGEVVK